MAKTKGPRLGRPPSSTALETKHRIMDVACEVFASRGYGATTNKDVATSAGITAGALYYYFDSKLDMYLAVFEHIHDGLDAGLLAASESEETFDAKLRSILEAIWTMNRASPRIARFYKTARTDRLRHPELRASIPSPPGEGAAFVKDLVEVGVATGEIAPDMRREVAALLRTTFVGLLDSASDDPAQERLAIDGILALLDGKLLEQGDGLRPAT